MKKESFVHQIKKGVEDNFKSMKAIVLQNIPINPEGVSLI